MITGIDALGAAMYSRLNVENKPGYTWLTGSSFSTWYNDSLRTTTQFHNMIGLLKEIISNPTLEKIPVVPQRLIPNGATPNPVFKLDANAAKKGVRSIAWFTTDKPLRSEWVWGQAYLKDGVTGFVAPVGSGKLYAFRLDITFRGQSHATFKLLFNELFLLK